MVGAVEQGKTSLLVASARADLERRDCALIVLDPKGDAADAVLSVVPAERTCTLLDMAAPRAGFNPLSANAAPDAIADHVVVRGLTRRLSIAAEHARDRMDRLGEIDAASQDVLTDVVRALEEQLWMVRVQFGGEH